MADCVNVLKKGIAENDGILDEAECNCYSRVPPQKFYDWTGVSASSCGPGSGLSFEAERELCIERNKTNSMSNVQNSTETFS